MRSVPTVVLIPGLAADGAMWAAQCAALAPVCDVRVSDVHFKCET